MLKTEIGKTAGMVWEHLAKNGKASFIGLKQKTGINPEMLHQAIGWLARENKICLDRNAKYTCVCLTDDETKKYSLRHPVRDKPTDIRGDEASECGARL